MDRGNSSTPHLEKIPLNEVQHNNFLTDIVRTGQATGDSSQQLRLGPGDRKAQQN